MDVTKLRSQLPRGAVKTIAQRSALSEPTVIKVLNGQKVSQENKERVTDIAINYLEELKAKEKQTTARLNNVLTA